MNLGCLFANKRPAVEVEARGARYLDTPFSIGAVTAKAAGLAIMVASRQPVDRAKSGTRDLGVVLPRPRSQNFSAAFAHGDAAVNRSAMATAL